MLGYLLPCLRGDYGGAFCSRVDEPPKVKEFGKTLGEGSFAVVSLVRDVADREFALKRSKDILADQNILTEHAILLFLNQQSGRGQGYIVQQEGFLFYEERASLLLELGKETLYQKIREGYPFSFVAVRNIVRDILLGLSFLKQHGVIHGDLKTDNILFFSHTIKIVDFGCAFYSQEPGECMLNQVATPPEKLVGIHPYTHAVDMWGVGLLIVAMMARQNCFMWTTPGDLALQHEVVVGESYQTELYYKSSENGKKMIKNNRNETAYYFPPSLKKVFESSEEEDGDVKVNSSLVDLVKKMLALDPEKRIDPLVSLNHPFFRSQSQDCCLFAWLDP